MSLTKRFLALAALCTFAGLAFGQTSEPAYRLKANDQIRMSVFQHTDLLSEVQLTLSGEASFPLIGTVQLGGKTLKEAEEVLTTLYNADYLVEPKLSINLLAASAERVTVIGAVEKPGEIAIPPNTRLDLVSAIDWAGGPSAHADQTRVELKREELTETYDLRKLRSKGAAQVLLQHGDRINLPASPFANKTVMVTGEIKRPGSVMFPVSGKLDLDMAIGLAGGLTEAADTRRITVKRGGRFYSASLRSGQRTLAPGDIITVPPSLFLGKNVTVMGLVAKPGPVAFPADGKLDILAAISRAGGFARLANQKNVTITRRSGEKSQSWPVNLADMAKGKVPTIYLVPGDTISVPERRF